MKQLLRTLDFGAMVLLLITSTHVYGQTVNIPPDHNTAGTLSPPPSCDPDEPGEVLWTIQNNSNCDLTMWFWVTVDGVDKRITKSISSGSSVNITVQDVLAAFGGLNETFSISNASFQLNQSSGETAIGYGYPNSMVRLFNPNLPAPCNCILMDWNQATKTIVFSNCN
ncbi:MAG: hypothetical protein L6Q78_11230 [Bacteroidia bacterium]|nr:hypothetical protein [Bacteroidia bacterium]